MKEKKKERKWLVPEQRSVYSKENGKGQRVADVKEEILLKKGYMYS